MDNNDNKTIRLGITDKEISNLAWDKLIKIPIGIGLGLVGGTILGITLLTTVTGFVIGGSCFGLGMWLSYSGKTGITIDHLKKFKVYTKSLTDTILGTTIEDKANDKANELMSKYGSRYEFSPQKISEKVDSNCFKHEMYKYGKNNIWVINKIGDNAILSVLDEKGEPVAVYLVTLDYRDKQKTCLFKL